MRIAVNTRMLIKGKMEGIGYFTMETMKRMTASHPEHDFFFIFDRPFDRDFLFSSNVKGIYIPPPARHPLLWYCWYEWSLPLLLRKHKPDLFIGTDGYMPGKTSVPGIAVIHDLNFEHYPEDMPFFNRTFYRYYFPRYARRAKRIAAVSNYTKNDIASTYHVDTNKIDVVYNGVSPLFSPLPEPEILDARKKHSLGRPYFLHIGALHQRKNITGLMKAFDSFKQRNDSQVALLLAGHKRWWTPEMETTYQSMQFRDDVIFTGRLSEEDLRKVTASALALTYVSWFEGFGIPIVEAMRSGVPVITSNVTSMPEVAGDAALLCDPFSVESITEAMTKIWSDPALRKNLVEKGLERQKMFSWENTAHALWQTVEKTINS